MKNNFFLKKNNYCIVKLGCQLWGMDYTKCRANNEYGLSLVKSYINLGQI